MYPYLPLLLMGVADDLYAQTVQPNIILINIDDLGWTDLSCKGSSYYETPHIDSLYHASIRFTQAYAGASNSAPSRACLLTGQYTPRHGIFTVANPDRGKPEDRKLIPIPNRTSLPDGFQLLPKVLHNAGYQTFHVGKWHITENPLEWGIDKNIGGNHAGNPSTYFSPYHNPNLPDGKKGEFLPDRLGHEAVQLIEQADRSKPFFLYYATYEVHTPLQAEENLIRKYRQKQPTKAHCNPVYAALIEAMDRNVGRIVQAIKDNGLEENTLIIFTSDNGGVYDISKQWPLRAGKGSFYEGGIRIPLAFYWKGHFSPCEYTHLIASQLDIFPTILDLAGIDKSHLLLDGTSLCSLLTDGTQNHLAERTLYWHFPAYLEGGNKETTDTVFRSRPVSVIRQGEWKLIENYETKNYELYHITQDISEQKEVSAFYPNMVKKLSEKLNRWKKETHAPIPTQLNPSYRKK